MHTDKKGDCMVLIEHIKQDWSVRLPYHLRHNRYRGLSRPSYSLLCVMYYLIKSAVLLCLFLSFVSMKFLFWDIWVEVLGSHHDEYDEDDDDEEDDDEEEEETYEEVEELPFCQLFTVGDEMCLLVDHVEMCPDETAFIRVVDDEGYTPLYKRKIRRDKNNNRFIVFSGRNYYLNDKKTQPTVRGRK